MLFTGHILSDHACTGPSLAQASHVYPCLESAEGLQHWSFEKLALQGLPNHQGIVSEVGSAIGEDMAVRDSASEDVRRTRGRCRTLEGRLHTILKVIPGEISVQVWMLPALEMAILSQIMDHWAPPAGCEQRCPYTAATALVHCSS